MPVTTATAQIAGLALNFEAGKSAPDWIQLIPAGPNIDGRDGRKWILPDPASIVEAFNRHGADLPIDLEHATHIKGAKGEPAPAVGWIKGLEVRSGEIWGRVEWNRQGSEALNSQAYRYISPVFRFDPTSKRITQLRSAGLTNLPNLQIEALNSEGDEEETQMDETVLEALGLNSDAGPADAVIAIGKLQGERDTALNSAQHPDPALFVPKADHDAALNRISEFEAGEKSRGDDAIKAALDNAIEAGKIVPASRDFYEAACRAEGGLDAFNTMIETAPVIAGKSGLDDKAPGKGGDGLSEEELAVCRALDQDPAEFAKALAAEKQE